MLISISSLANTQCGQYLDSSQENIELFHLYTKRLEIKKLHGNDEINAYLDLIEITEITKRSEGIIRRELFLAALKASQKSLTAAKYAFESKRMYLVVRNLGIFYDSKLIGGITFGQFTEEIMFKLRKETDVVNNGEKWITYGILIAPEHQGKGFGTELTKRRIAFAFESLGADGVLVEIDDDNLPSLWLSTRKFGFKPLGLKAWWGKQLGLYYLKKN